MNALAVAVIDTEIADCRATGHTGNVENLLDARAAVAELIAADVEYDAAGAHRLDTYRQWNKDHGPTTADDGDFAVLHAADARLEAARARRRAALNAAQGGDA